MKLDDNNHDSDERSFRSDEEKNKSYTLADFIAALPIPKELDGLVVNDNNEKVDVLFPLSRINIFVGTNNSGKSYILRELMKSEIGLNYLSQKLCDELNEYVETVKSEFYTSFENYRIKIATEEMPESSRKIYDNTQQRIDVLAQKAFSLFVTTDNFHQKVTDIDNLIEYIPVPMDNPSIPREPDQADKMITVLST